jgi:DNA-binding beta-propeller fold protein YncE
MAHRHEELDVVEPGLDRRAAEGLRAPGCLAADIEGWLAVSDAGHDRVLVGQSVGDSFDVEHVVGRGEPGLDDGPFDEAAFRDPQGLALSGDLLIVADRGNHAVRMIDLRSHEVHTMAGTGEPAVGGVRGGGDPLETALHSPWDVLLWDYDLFVTMAGTGEIWRLDLRDRTLALHAPRTEGGEPREATAMALATDGHSLYVADAAADSICRIPFEPEGGEVEALAGSDGDHGDLRGPAGLAWGQGNHRLWIADSGHDRLRMLEPGTRRVEMVEPFAARLDGPTGLASAGHLLFVADTGHDRVLRVDQIDKRVTELAVEL